MTSWEECQESNRRISHTKVSRPSTQELAEAEFARARNYTQFVQKICTSRHSPKLKPSATSHNYPTAYAVDAACSGNPGDDGVSEESRPNTGKQLIFHQGPFKDGTNNVGEFLALVHALAMLTQAPQ
jgi:ribonuclease HI